MTLAQPAKEDTRPGTLLPTVLLVDDDLQTLSSLRRALRNEPYEVLCTDDPFEALEWIKSGDIHLVITDEFMPAMLGTELLEAVRVHSPESATVLLTGYPSPSVTYRSFQQRVDLLLIKPWDDQELREAARRLLRVRAPDGE